MMSFKTAAGKQADGRWRGEERDKDKVDKDTHIYMFCLDGWRLGVGLRAAQQALFFIPLFLSLSDHTPAREDRKERRHLCYPLPISLDLTGCSA